MASPGPPTRSAETEGQRALRHRLPDIALLSFVDGESIRDKAGPPLPIKLLDRIDDTAPSAQVVGLGYPRATNKTPFDNASKPALDVVPIKWNGGACKKDDRRCGIIDPTDVPRGMSGGPVLLIAQDQQAFVVATTITNKAAQNAWRANIFFNTYFVNLSHYVWQPGEAPATGDSQSVATNPRKFVYLKSFSPDTPETKNYPKILNRALLGVRSAVSGAAQQLKLNSTPSARTKLSDFVQAEVKTLDPKNGDKASADHAKKIWKAEKDPLQVLFVDVLGPSLINSNIFLGDLSGKFDASNLLPLDFKFNQFSQIINVHSFVFAYAHAADARLRGDVLHEKLYLTEAFNKGEDVLKLLTDQDQNDKIDKFGVLLTLKTLVDQRRDDLSKQAQ